MRGVKLALTSAVLLLATVGGATQQPMTSEAVLIRDAKDQLVVSSVLGMPGDSLAARGETVT